MTSKSKLSSYFIITVVLALGLSISLQSLLAAWTAPTQTAPNCPAGSPGCDTPVNTGNSNQQKGGLLTLNGTGNALLVPGGDVGIGTINPGVRLHVADTNGEIIIEGTHATNPWVNLNFSQRGTVVNQIQAHGTETGSMFFVTKDPVSSALTERMRIKNDGNIGIGTTNPRAKLHVNGDSYIEGGGIGFMPAGGTSANNVIYRGGTDFTILRNYNSSSTVMQVWSPPGALGSSNAKEATIALVRGNEPDQEYFDLYNNGYSTETQHGIRIQKRGTGSYRDFVFDQYDGTTKTPLMNIKADGKIGIGTNVPQTKLDVNGDLTVSGAIKSYAYSPSNTVLYSAPTQRIQSWPGCNTTNRIKVFGAPGSGFFRVSFDVRGADGSDWMRAYLKCNGVQCSNILDIGVSTAYTTRTLDTTNFIPSGSEIEIAIEGREGYSGYTYAQTYCSGTQAIYVRNAYLKGSTTPGSYGVIVD